MTYFTHRKNTVTDHLVIWLNLLFKHSGKYNVFPKTRCQKGAIKYLWGIHSLELRLVKWFHQGLSSAI